MKTEQQVKNRIRDMRNYAIAKIQAKYPKADAHAFGEKIGLAPKKYRLKKDREELARQLPAYFEAIAEINAKFNAREEEWLAALNGEVIALASKHGVTDEIETRLEDSIAAG